jgi:phage head maturation protease
MEVFVVAVDNSSWDGAAAMSAATNSDDPAAAYRAICAGKRDGDPAVQATWALPHHKSPGVPPNADGVRNALAREPQTDGINHDEAKSHLQAHMEAIQAANERSELDEDLAQHNTELPAPVVQVRNAAKREVDFRILPWNTSIEHEFGTESYAPGAFDGVNPSDVLLMGLDHETLMGIDRKGQPVIKRRPMGVGTQYRNEPDAAYMTFKVARTVSGDEFLGLAADGVVKGVSVEWDDVPGGTKTHVRNGRRDTRNEKAALRDVSPTWRPAFKQAQLVAMRSAQEGQASMAEETKDAVEASASEPAPDYSPVINAMQSQFDGMRTQFVDRLDKMEEHQRSLFVPPSGQVQAKLPKLHEWASVAARMLIGGRIDDKEIHERALQDVISPDNPGQIPDAFVNDLIGVLTPRRPFLASTTQIAPPAVGLGMTVPVFDQHSTVGLQSEEKSDIDSTAMKVTTDTFNAITIAGGADVSIQLIRRGEPSFFDLLLRDIGQAYATAADLAAVNALLGAGVTSGATDMDPEDLEVGDAWANSIASIGLAPDRIWLSSTAVAEYIDAKDNGTNRPLYFNLNANFAAGTGTGGNVSALTPIFTPALDSSGVDAIIGPSSGFVWAEDGTFQLQVDVPSKAGRDIAVVGILFLVPRYPSAFTSYSLAS